MNNKKRFVPARPKRGQEEYFHALDKAHIIFVSGNAGCGKSFLALNKAIQCVNDNNCAIDKICIIRPYIFTSAENIGALPGTLDEKILPFVESVRDNLECLLPGKQAVDDTLNKIEFLTLSTLRGRSLHNRFIIVEEAQNVPLKDDGMLTILTRIGQNSHIVIAGDPSQCDIHFNNSSFIEAINALQTLDEVSYIEMNDITCIHRNPVVGKIITAFNAHRKTH